MLISQVSRLFLTCFSVISSLILTSAYKRHEDAKNKAKKRECGHRVRDVERGVFTFTPLVFTSTGGMGREATVFYRRLADLLATHWGQEYMVQLLTG